MIFFSRLGKYGRLGNQLFQIASTIGIATANQTNYAFPQWEYNNWLLKGLPTFTQMPSQYFIYEEHVRPFGRIPNLQGPHWDLIGYFQSYKYFEHVKDQIIDQFKFNLEVGESDNVAIHVRRGDYLGLANIYPIPSMNYYREAMKLFPDKRFSIFSDDIDWCKQNFDNEMCDFISNGDPLMDLLYFSKHSGYIIANSSYSWWGAYLGNKATVSPNVWINNEIQDSITDRIPPEWIRI